MCGVKSGAYNCGGGVPEERASDRAFSKESSTSTHTLTVSRASHATTTAISPSGLVSWLTTRDLSPQVQWASEVKKDEKEDDERKAVAVSRALRFTDDVEDGDFHDPYRSNDTADDNDDEVEYEDAKRASLDHHNAHLSRLQRRENGKLNEEGTDASEDDDAAATHEVRLPREDGLSEETASSSLNPCLLPGAHYRPRGEHRVSSASSPREQVTDVSFNACVGEKPWNVECRSFTPALSTAVSSSSCTYSPFVVAVTQIELSSEEDEREAEGCQGQQTIYYTGPQKADRQAEEANQRGPSKPCAQSYRTFLASPSAAPPTCSHRGDGLPLRESLSVNRCTPKRLPTPSSLQAQRSAPRGTTAESEYTTVCRLYNGRLTPDEMKESSELVEYLVWAERRRASRLQQLSDGSPPFVWKHDLSFSSSAFPKRMDEAMVSFSSPPPSSTSPLLPHGCERRWKQAVGKGASTHPPPAHSPRPSLDSASTALGHLLRMAYQCRQPPSRRPTLPPRTLSKTVVEPFGAAAPSRPVVYVAPPTSACEPATQLRSLSVEDYLTPDSPAARYIEWVANEVDLFEELVFGLPANPGDDDSYTPSEQLRTTGRVVKGGKLEQKKQKKMEDEESEREVVTHSAQRDQVLGRLASSVTDTVLDRFIADCALEMMTHLSSED